ncbi:MAG: hypothetical protein ACI4BI_06745 [Anaerotardibacter sp.]
MMYEEMMQEAKKESFEMNKVSNLFKVKKRTLLAVAGCVWFLAGCNIVNLGLIAWSSLESISMIIIMLAIVVFFAFGTMFFKITIKHTNRILGYKEATRPVWDFFDARGYVLMAIMMGGGILLRNSGFVPEVFIAFFYTGLGSALALAGVLFFAKFFATREISKK